MEFQTKIILISLAFSFIMGLITIPILKKLKVGGESLDEIINRYIKFKAKRRIYSYADTKIADEENTKEEQ